MIETVPVAVAGRVQSHIGAVHDADHARVGCQRNICRCERCARPRGNQCSGVDAAEAGREIVACARVVAGEEVIGAAAWRSGNTRDGTVPYCDVVEDGAVG